MKWSQKKHRTFATVFQHGYSTAFYASRITYLGRRRNWGKKHYFTMSLKHRGSTFWQGSQNCLLWVQGISWEKRIVLKTLFCSFFRTFSVDFLVIRQKFWQVLRTVKSLSRVALEDFFFGGIAQYLYICTWIFNKKLYFSHYSLKWLSKVHSTFLKEHF